MGRFIDADALQEEYVRLSGRELSLIEDAPTVDAVEVVRCKDCVEYLYCLQNEHNDPNGFCAWGKPREVEDEVTECTTHT